MDRERKAFEEWAGSAEGQLAREWAHDPVPLDEALTYFARQAWKARAALSRASGEATEAMVEAGARAIAGALSRAMNINDARKLARLCWGAMRAESEGGGAATEREQGEGAGNAAAGRTPAPREDRKAPPSAAPPSPGSDLLREVEAFLRAIGESPALLDTKDAATARELAGDLRALIEGCPHA